MSIGKFEMFVSFQLLKIGTLRAESVRVFLSGN